MIRTPRFSRYRCRYSSSLAVAGAADSPPLRGGSGEKRYSARAPSWATCQGRSCALDRLVTPSVKRVGERDHPLERLGGQDPPERGADRRGRERVARERAADPAGVLVVGAAFGTRSRSATSALIPNAPAGTPPAIDLPMVSMSGSRPPARRAAARAGAEGVGLVDDQEGAGLARELAQRARGSPVRAGRCRCWSAPARRARRRRRRRAARARARRASLNSTTSVVTVGSTGGPTLPSRETGRPSSPTTMNVSSTVPW